MSQPYNMTLEEAPDPRDVQRVEEGLRAYNRLYAPDDNYAHLTVLARDADRQLVGGLLGATYWGWMHVDLFWLDEGTRQQGLGSALLAAAESEAVRRGCRHAHLDTMSWQAPAFYERHGYVLYGVLDDLPAGHKRLFYRKDLKPLPGPSDRERNTR